MHISVYLRVYLRVSPCIPSLAGTVRSMLASPTLYLYISNPISPYISLYLPISPYISLVRSMLANPSVRAAVSRVAVS